MVKEEKKKYEYKKKPNWKNATGRPTDYKEEYCDDIVEYFETLKAEILIELEFHRPSKNEELVSIANPLVDDKEEINDTLWASWVKKINQKVIAHKFPTFIRYALKIWVNQDTLYEWANNYEKFSEAMKLCKQIQEALLLENWLSWLFNPTMVQFILKNNHWYKDKTEIINNNININKEYNDLSEKQQEAVDSILSLL